LTVRLARVTSAGSRSLAEPVGLVGVEDGSDGRIEVLRTGERGEPLVESAKDAFLSD
jgi:hypothetical protein